MQREASPTSVSTSTPAPGSKWKAAARVLDASKQPALVRVVNDVLHQRGPPVRTVQDRNERRLRAIFMQLTQGAKEISEARLRQYVARRLDRRAADKKVDAVMQRVMNYFDTEGADEGGGDGNIDFEEFRQGCAKFGDEILELNDGNAILGQMISVAQLKYLFDSIDQNHDEQIDEEELATRIESAYRERFKKGVTPEERKKLVDAIKLKFDTGGDDEDDDQADGKISFEEFVVGCKRLGIRDVSDANDVFGKVIVGIQRLQRLESRREQTLRPFFDKLDADGDGCVSAADLGKLVARQLRRGLADGELSVLMQYFDKELVSGGGGRAEDGEISFSEFCEGIEKLGVEDVEDVKDVLVKMLSVARTQVTLRHTEMGGYGRMARVVFVRQQLQPDELLQIIKTDFKLPLPNMLLACDAGSCHPSEMLPAGAPDLTNWFAEIWKTGEPESFLAALKKRDTINHVLLRKLLATFGALIEAAVNSDSWIVVDRTSINMSATAELLLELALQKQDASAKRPTILVVDSYDRLDDAQNRYLDASQEDGYAAHPHGGSAGYADGLAPNAPTEQPHWMRPGNDVSELERLQQRAQRDIHNQQVVQEAGWFYNPADYVDASMVQFLKREQLRFQGQQSRAAAAEADGGGAGARGGVGGAESGSDGGDPRRSWRPAYAQRLFASGTHYIYVRQSKYMCPLDVLGQMCYVFANGATRTAHKLRHSIELGKPLVLLRSTGGSTEAFASLHEVIVEEGARGGYGGQRPEWHEAKKMDKGELLRRDLADDAKNLPTRKRGLTHCANVVLSHACSQREAPAEPAPRAAEHGGWASSACSAEMDELESGRRRGVTRALGLGLGLGHGAAPRLPVYRERRGGGLHRACEVAESERPAVWAESFAGGVPDYMAMKELRQRAPQLFRKRIVTVDLATKSPEEVLAKLTECFATTAGGLPALGLANAERNVVYSAWRHHLLLHSNSRTYDKSSAAMQWVMWALALVTTAVAIVKSVLFGPSTSGLAFDWSDHARRTESALAIVAVLLPICSALVATVMSRLRSRIKWSTCLSSSHQIVAEIYKFRARTLEYDLSSRLVAKRSDEGGDELKFEPLSPAEKERVARETFVKRISLIYADALSHEVGKGGALSHHGTSQLGTATDQEVDRLQQRLVEHVDDQLYPHTRWAHRARRGRGRRGLTPSHTEGSVAAAAPGASKPDAEEEDDLISPMSIETYMGYRAKYVLAQLEYLAPRLARHLQFLEVLGFVTNSVGAGLAAFGYTEWVAMSVAFYGVVAAVLQHLNLQQQVEATNQALRDVHNMLIWWNGHGIIEHRTRSSKQHVVNVVETAWLSVVAARTNVAARVPTSFEESKGGHEGIETGAPHTGSSAVHPAQATANQLMSSSL